MAKIIDRVKESLINNIFTMEDIDNIMSEEKYYPIETDEDDESEEGILKYTNKRSQIWVKYIQENGDYLVSDVTMRTKKNGKTTVHAFRNVEDIKKMIDYFRDNEKYDEFLVFVFGIFLARRIGDTLSLKWSDFYEENGNRKRILNTLIEKKTDKMIDIAITDVTWKYIDWYCGKVKINPLEHLNENIFNMKPAAFRYEFKKAADYNAIQNVSTHSMRKTFGYIAHEINKFDPDCLPALQTVLGHNDIETTKRYIDIMNDKAEKMFNDVGKYVEDIDNGIKPVIDNTPVIVLKTNDLRDILVMAYNMGVSKGIDMSAETMNELLDTVENLRVS